MSFHKLRKLNCYFRGIYFDYFFGEPDRNNENRYFDCFRFSDFLKFCKDHNFDINALVLLDTPYLKEFKYLVYHFCYMEFKEEREKTYQKEKK